MLQVEGRPADSAEAIGRDMLAAIGRWPAIGYLLGRLVGAETWWRAKQAMRLLLAVVRA